MATSKQVTTRNQRFAERSWSYVSRIVDGPRGGEDFSIFAKSFPSVIHSCGLAQALAFARAKGRDDVVEALAAVLGREKDAGDLVEESRTAGMTDYLRLSRDALAAASWIKRQTEALGKERGNDPHD